ncbi:unnamed protein product [Linum trigynum]|uniref:Receptor-like serine/threonine-protein kinase n=1 Tax=Linum trigynum TaxID=586398 RepID=A0AAV2CSV0_9ROSI
MDLAAAITISFLLHLIISLHLCTSSTTDTISFNQSLTDGQVLVSNGDQTYTLGFFSPTAGNSSNRYLGIWYTKVPVLTVVWVANRDDPINDTTGSLSFDQRSNDLVLQRRGTTGNPVPVWSANVPTTAGMNNSTAKLLDTGNFVVLRSDGTTVTWQSFDHLTDTLFPNMKFGLDLRTGLNRSLRSWKSPDDPASGDWSMGIDPRGVPQIIIYHQTGRTKRWRYTPWNRNSIHDSVVNYNYTTRLFAGDINSSETTTVWAFRDPAIVSRMYLDSLGFMKLNIWQNDQWVEFSSGPKDPCDYYGRCGPNGNCDPYRAGELECDCLPGFEPKFPNNWSVRDSSGGCVRKRNSTCTDGEGFVKLENAKVPDTVTGRLNVGVDLETCRTECLKNCSCTAYANANVTNGVGCVTLYGDLMDTRVFTDGRQDLFVRVDAIALDEYMRKSEGQSGEEKKKKKEKKKEVLVITLASVGATAAVVLGVSIVCCCLLKWRRKEGRGGTNRIVNGVHYDVKNENLYEEKDSSVSIFDVNDIFAATGNFSLANKIGQGGFGSVYKGLLPDGQKVAVKRLSQTSSQGIEEFKNEVKLVSKLQHKNLARLFGCCIHGEEKMLVYEYLPNKSLDFFIFDKTKGSLLTWKTRFDIVNGIARGLLYLHRDSRLKIIHRDLKPSNILLDATMNPKISDFGMARLFGEDQTEANTNRVMGTYGYMSPEYAIKGLYSTKSDVFSFGILVLEIVSGMRSNHCYKENPSLSLIGHVWDLWRAGRALEVADSPTMGKSYSADQVMRCIQIGLLCVQESPTDRPTMSNVVSMLGNATTLPSPKEPAFILVRQYDDADSSADDRPAVISINHVSITTIEAR